MSEEDIVDIWNTFKDYIEKKQSAIAAERYVDMLADYGIDDQVFISALGHDVVLDHAINYYLDIDEEHTEDY